MVFVGITVVSLIVILLLIANLSASALRSYQQQRNAAVAEAQTANTQGLVLIHTRNGMMVSRQNSVARPAFTLPPSWYSRLRKSVSLGLLLMVLITFGVQRGLADGTLRDLSQGLSLFTSAQFNATDIRAAAHVSALNASQQLERISQLDPNQYSSSAEFNNWAYSACSTAALTEVFNAYGRNFRITDVLKVEAQIGAITPQLGLVDPSGIQLTAAQFGFKTTWGLSWKLDQVITTANAGQPMIVSFPPDRYAGGHILVVTGGDSTYVYLADSSLWNRHSLTHGEFMQWWEGFAAVVMPG